MHWGGRNVGVPLVTRATVAHLKICKSKIVGRRGWCSGKSGVHCALARPGTEGRARATEIQNISASDFRGEKSRNIFPTIEATMLYI